MSEFEGIFINIQILRDLNLSNSEKFVFSLLSTMAEKDGSVKISNQFIAKYINSSEGYIVKVLKSLREKGYIKNEYVGNKYSNRIIKISK